jgi:hypothetical protein
MVKLSRVQLNKWGWHTLDNYNENNYALALAETEYDTKQLIIRVSPHLCPVPAQILYSVTQDRFDDPGMMCHSMPCMARSRNEIVMINNWRIIPQMYGLYLSYEKGEWWGKPNRQEETRENVFLGDYVGAHVTLPPVKRGFEWL